MATPRKQSARSRGSIQPRRGRSARGLNFTAHENSYLRQSMRPLHVLVFLLPLVVAYELGSALYLRGNEGAEQVIRARRLLSGFFELFGAPGLYLPGLALVVVLLIWHVMTRDRWRIKPGVLGGMLVESLVWTLPLLVLGRLVYRLVSEDAAPGMVETVGDMAAGAGLSKPALATISIGAGLYEELLFRMVGIALVHVIAADLLGVKDTAAKVIAVTVSAAAFAAYHDIWPATGGIDWARAVVFFFAGLYFGGVYVLRGFGIVVAVHALYDLAVLVLLPGSPAPNG